MKNLITEYEIAKRESDAAENAMLENPENAELETAFDNAYKKEFDSFVNLANGIKEITNGKISFETAKIMINTRFAEIKNLIALYQ